MGHILQLRSLVLLLLFTCLLTPLQMAWADSATVTIGTAASSNGSWSGATPDVWTPGASGVSTVAVSEITDRLANSGVIIGSGSSITVATPISWSSSNPLTLNAGTDISIAAAISGTNGILKLYYGSSYSLNNGARISLSAGSTFFTKQGSNAEISWTVIAGLGSAGSTTGTDLQGINGNLAGSYVLGADIDASGTSTWNSNGSGGYYGFSQIGTNTTPFTGSFNGLGHTISNLYINRGSTTYMGLFGYNTGSISNVGVEGGSITGKNRVGGLAGHSSGSISNAYATANITGAYSVGGLVGYNYGGSISNAYATGSVTGSMDYTGGLVGWNSGSISDSYATGSVTGATTDTGGLVGYNSGSISNAYAIGSVTGVTNVGGLVGLNEGTVSNSYWDETTGIATGIGIDDGTLTNVVGKTTAQLAAALPTGFSNTVWGNAGNQTTPYLLSNASLATTSGSVIMGSDSSSTPTRYGVILNATQLQNINSTGLSGNYVLGADIDASATSSWNSDGSGGYYGFERIGDYSTAFSGVFNGLGHTISNLYINRSNRHAMGLFGRNSGTISNLGLIDASIAVSGGAAEDVGGLAGENTGTISNSYVTGSVTGYSNVGGLVGWNSSSATISNSYTTAAVTSYGGVGGLVGGNAGSISNSYAAGAVTGSATVGGLVGWNSSTATISKTYAVGSVNGSSNVGGLVGYNDDGSINAGFFDTTTTHQSNGCGYNSISGTCGVTGRSTYWMKTFNNFYAWGPSISSTGGSSAVWRIYATNTYPLLRSFLIPMSVTASDAAKNYDSTAYNGGNGVQYAPAGYNPARVAGTLTYSGSSQGATAIGSYTITPDGLFSDQLGYDISFISGVLNINGYWLTLGISGSGTVNSSNGSGLGYACNTATCTAVPFGSGDTVTLTATGSNSSFSNWSGDYVSISNPGSITMDTNKTVISTFAPDPAKVTIDGDSTAYYSINTALAAPAQAAVVRATATNFTENVTMQNSHTLTLKGGYSDSNFTSQTGNSTINGTLTISSGTLIVDRVVMGP